MINFMRSEYKIASMVLIIIIVVVGFLTYGGGESMLGLSSTDTDDLISLLPGVFVVLIGFYAVSQSSGFMLSGAVGGLGLAFAYLIYLLNEATLLIPELEMSVSDTQLVVIVVFLVIGAGMAVMDR